MCLGIPGRIVAVEDPERLTAWVEVSGVRRSVNVLCVLEDGAPAASCVGAWVLVHAGFALARIDAGEAARTLALLDELGEQEPGP
ncbi:MAG: HypC/HybG/HupF family hydrogenase formation chaperone [Pseudomonadales bacterium]|jgi:hydrogenase expression/formation protein HypC|nr:HypC/HybG/HupF family hydrogenase formation chaperone [Pseudomonadales bacterium]